MCHIVTHVYFNSKNQKRAYPVSGAHLTPLSMQCIYVAILTYITVLQGPKIISNDVLSSEPYFLGNW